MTAISERQDIEMSLVRTLSVRGLILSGNLSAEDKRERIRVAILTMNLKDAPYNDQYTYGQAFQRCYDRVVEMRRVQRETQRPIAVPNTPEEDAEDAAEDEAEDAELD